MRFLHTSDWHIGRSLYEKRTQALHAAFLDWLVGTIRNQSVETLLVAGDIFDTATVGNVSQQTYYDFLTKVRAAGCAHVVIIGGNHDSPSFIDAPAALLSSMDIHVVGSPSDDVSDEVIALRDTGGRVAAFVCAVPFLRDRDIRTSAVLESLDDKNEALSAAIAAHYREVAQAVEQMMPAEGNPPVVAMGHLFVSGSQQGEGERDLYVGSLAQVPASVFPPLFDYVALGHLHRGQQVGSCPCIRYSGAPLPMGFDDGSLHPHVLVVDIPKARSVPTVTPIAVPIFMPMRRISGTVADIECEFKARVATGTPLWVEVVHDGQDIVSDLKQRIDALVDGSTVEVLRIKTNVTTAYLEAGPSVELQDLQVDEVFERCLQAHEIPEAQQEELRLLYRIAAQRVFEGDSAAEGDC